MPCNLTRVGPMRFQAPTGATVTLKISSPSGADTFHKAVYAGASLPTPAQQLTLTVLAGAKELNLQVAFMIPPGETAELREVCDLNPLIDMVGPADPFRQLEIEGV